MKYVVQNYAAESCTVDKRPMEVPTLKLAREEVKARLGVSALRSSRKLSPGELVRTCPGALEAYRVIGIGPGNLGGVEIHKVTARTPDPRRVPPRAPESCPMRAAAKRSAAAGDVKERLLAEFDRLQAKKGRAYVTLAELRAALPDVNREDFDRLVNELRREWVLTLAVAEGLHERVPKKVVDAGIVEAGRNLVYVARREQEDDDDDDDPLPRPDRGVVMDAVRTVSDRERGRSIGAPLVSVREVREVARLPKDRFDAAMLELRRDGLVSLHYHDHAGGLSREEKAQLVKDSRGIYYVGVSLVESRR